MAAQPLLVDTTGARMEIVGGLHVVMTDVVPEEEADFNRWYEEEHIPERVALDGCLSARRFRRFRHDAGGPSPAELQGQLQRGRQYLVAYELRDAEVFESPEWQNLSKNQSEHSRRMLGSMRQVVAGTYTLLRTFEK
jgi:hypothetical protein